VAFLYGVDRRVVFMRLYSGTFVVAAKFHVIEMIGFFQKQWVSFLLTGAILLFAMDGCREKQAYQTFRVAYSMAQGGTSHLAALHFKELVEERSHQKIMVKLYPNSVLGDERALVESLNLKGVDMVIAGPSVIGNYAPEYGLIEAPFLFRDFDHLDKVLYGQIGKEMNEVMRETQGLHFIEYFHRGPRYLTTTARPVKTPGDLVGLKLRVPALPVYIKSWSLFGANPTPLNYSDMFIALKQGVVEGQENPLEVIYTSHLYEVQRYIMETEHLLSFYVLVVGDPFYKKFDADAQKLLLQASHESAKYHNGLVEQYEEFYRKELLREGIEFIEVNKDAFYKLASEKLPREFEGLWKPGVYERIINTR
jgi:tripartite ATP-independent transporter DctP family solute receptor